MKKLPVIQNDFKEFTLNYETDQTVFLPAYSNTVFNPYSDSIANPE